MMDVKQKSNGYLCHDSETCVGTSAALAFLFTTSVLHSMNAAMFVPQTNLVKLRCEEGADVTEDVSS